LSQSRKRQHRRAPKCNDELAPPHRFSLRPRRAS
jgi:hypothetical protein